MMEIYRQNSLTAVRRLISQLDRRPWSLTYGCLDREYWHYKTLREFPRLIFQQGLWGLALMVRHPFPGNEFSGSARVRDWIQAGLAFWERMRHGDGSVDEWYRNERSFCATAFTAASVAQTFLLMGKEFDPAVQDRGIRALEKTVRWLTRHKNREAANQMAAGLVAVDGLRRLTNAKEFDLLFEEWKVDLLRLQHPEGWFSEYGGADIGYSLLTLDLLTHLWQPSGDSDLQRAIEALLDFLSYFVHPDGTVGGVYSHRSTRHCFPYGVERMAACGNLKARRIVGAVRSAIAQGTVPLPATVDDTYATYFYLNSFCLAGCAGLGENIEADSPVFVEEPRKRIFPAAGLLVHETKAYRLVINTRSGVWEGKSFQGDRLGDSGYVVVTADGQRLSSERAKAAGRFSLTEPSGEEILLDFSTRFAQLDSPVPLQGRFLLFALWTHTLGAIVPIGNWFNRMLKRRNVSGAAPSRIFLKRRWRLREEALELVDEIRMPARMKIKSLLRASEATGMYSPSSEMYAPSVLRLGAPAVSREEMDLLRKNRVVHLRTTFQFQVPCELQRI